MPVSPIQFKLDAYVAFILNHLESTNALFVDDIYTRDDLYRGLLAYYIVELVLDLQSGQNMNPLSYLETFRGSPLVQKWFSAYLPEYPKDLSVKKVLTQYVIDVQSKYNVIFNAISNTSILAFEIEPGELHHLLRSRHLYVHKGPIHNFTHLKTENSYFQYISPGQFVLECLKEQRFDILSSYRTDLDVKQAMCAHAHTFWQLDKNITKFDCLKLYILAQQGTYADISEKSMSLSIDLDLSLPEVYDIYLTSHVPIKPELYPEIAF